MPTPKIKSRSLAGMLDPSTYTVTVEDDEEDTTDPATEEAPPLPWWVSPCEIHPDHMVTLPENQRSVSPKAVRFALYCQQCTSDDRVLDRHPILDRMYAKSREFSRIRYRTLLTEEKIKQNGGQAIYAAIPLHDYPTRSIICGHCSRPQRLIMSPGDLRRPYVIYRCYEATRDVQGRIVEHGCYAQLMIDMRRAAEHLRTHPRGDFTSYCIEAPNMPTDPVHGRYRFINADGTPEDRPCTILRITHRDPADLETKATIRVQLFEDEANAAAINAQANLEPGTITPDTTDIDIRDVIKGLSPGMWWPTSVARPD